MTDAALTHPTPREVASPTEFASVALWAEQQRFDLSRLSKELRSLQQTVAGSTDCGSETEDASVQASFAPMLDRLLEAAMDQLDASVELARNEARAVVAAATQQATLLLETVGADPVTVRRVTAGRPEVVPALRRPRTTAELLQPALDGDGMEPREEPESHRVLDGTFDDDVPLLDDTGGLAGRDLSQAHELFWGGALSDRPVRDRLRRFGQRSNP